MTDQQVPARIQQIKKSLYQISLSGSVKVDHDITAKNYVESLLHWPGIYEIKAGKPHHFSNCIVDTVKGKGIRLNQAEISR